MSRRTTRPGPLEELPLERFLPIESNIPPTPSKQHAHLKRPLSPGTPSLYNPIKRRILDEEGIFSPTKSVKSPYEDHGRFAPSHFHSLLQGPNSPARKLDFGLPKASGSDPNIGAKYASVGDTFTPHSASLSAIDKLAPSPELVSKTKTRSALAKAPAVSPSRSSSTAPCGYLSSDDDNDDVDMWYDPRPCSSSSQSPAPILIAREITHPDRQSIHYPGFDIHQDAFIVLPSTASRPRTRAQVRAQAEKDAMQIDGLPEAMSKKETDKENAAPRRRAQKAVPMLLEPSDAAWLKAGLLSPAKQRQGHANSKTVPATPHPKKVHELPPLREGSLTPRRRPLAPDAGSPMKLSSPARTPVGPAERRARRMMMEEEADEVENDDEMPMVLCL